jgi:hypothetical protein
MEPQGMRVRITWPLTQMLPFCSMAHHQDWTMGLDHIRAEIEHMRVQIKRQQKDILSLQKAGIATASAVALLERMHNKVDELIGERNRLTGEARSDQKTYASGKVVRGTSTHRGL